MVRAAGGVVVVGVLATGCFNPPGLGGADGTATSGSTTGGAGESAADGTTLVTATSGPTTGGPAATSDEATSDEATGGSTGTTGTTEPTDLLCGDGHVDLGEDCDDGNRDDQDGCSAFCTRDALFVFVTSSMYPGNFGGLAVADEECAMAAVGLTGFPGATFTAWLSDVVTPVKTRIAEHTLPFIRVGDPEHLVVADGTAGLLSGSLQQPIDRTEVGAQLGVSLPVCGDAELLVWTGSSATGEKLDSCEGWTLTTDAGAGGLAGTTTSEWSQGCAGLCSVAARLYCVENP